MSRYGFGLGLVVVSRDDRRVDAASASAFEFDPLTEIVPLIGSKEGHLASRAGVRRAGRRRDRSRAGLQRVPGRRAARRAAKPYRYALRPRTNFLVDLDEIPRDTLRRARMLYLNYPNNPTAAIAPRGLPRARRRAVPRARHSARVRQRVLRARVRRLRAAEHLRDRRRARRRDRVPLAVEDVQHDGLALRLGGRARRRSRRR